MRYKKKHYKPVWEVYRDCDRDRFPELAFTLYYFIAKLYKRLKEENIKDVFFFAREGQLLKKLFDLYRDGNGAADEIRTHYLLVSRQSTMLPALKEIDEETFDVIFRQYIDISIYDFLASIGFQASEISEIGERIKFDIHTEIEEFKDSVVYKRLVRDDRFRELYEIKRREQKKYFRQYIDSFGVDYSERMCVVDVGWKGTIQDNIFEFLNEEIEIVGFYIGLIGHGIVNARNRKEGILFNTDLKKFSPYFFVFGDTTSLYETMLGASHGSACRYGIKDGRIETFLVEDEREEKLFDNVVKPIQEYIESIFVNIDKACREVGMPPEEFWADIHARMVFKPTGKQITTFANMYHRENFGIFKYSFFYGKEIEADNRFKALCKLIRHPGEFLNSGYWAPAVLFNYGLGNLRWFYGIIAYTKFYYIKPIQLRGENR